MKLEPYLYFNGDCEEAMTAYAKALDGTYTVAMRYDKSNMNVPESYKNKILHSVLTFGESSMMASDYHPDSNLIAGNKINLSIGTKGLEKGRKVFDELSAGGQLTMKLEKQFWGAWFGQFTDRFGINWMFNIEE